MFCPIVKGQTLLMLNRGQAHMKEERMCMLNRGQRNSGQGHVYLQKGQQMLN